MRTEDMTSTTTTHQRPPSMWVSSNVNAVEQISRAMLATCRHAHGFAPNHGFCRKLTDLLKVRHMPTDYQYGVCCNAAAEQRRKQQGLQQWRRRHAVRSSLYFFAPLLWGENMTWTIPRTTPDTCTTPA